MDKSTTQLVESDLSNISENSEYRSNESKIKNQRVILNVGGFKHETLWNTLNKIPNSRLGQLGNITNSKNLYNLCDDFNEENNEYFFDRDPTLFSCILNYYRIGKLHLSDDICPTSLNIELFYWGLDEPYMDLCCEEKLYKKQKEIDQSISIYNRIIKEEKSILSHEIDVNKSKFLILKKKIWNTVDNPFEPNSYFFAKIFGILSIFFICLSSINLILSTIPEFNRFDRPRNKFENITVNGNIRDDTYSIADFLNIIEVICIIWFTFEFLIRFFTTSYIFKFLCDFLNIIDLLCILPFYFGLFLNEYGFFIKIKYLLQMLRVLRLLKLGRYSNGIKAFAYALKTSSEALFYLLILLCLNVLLFSSFVYFAEQENPDTAFTSIIASCWWAIITTTTVGYGDMSPATPLGKLVGSFCAIIGIIMFALPLAVISNNFGEYEKQFERRQKVIKSLRSKLDDIPSTKKRNNSKETVLFDKVQNFENTKLF